MCVYIVELKLSSQSLLFSGELLFDNPPVFNDSHVFRLGLLGSYLRWRVRVANQSKEVLRREPPSDEANGGDRKVTKTMQHKLVIENFINKGTEGRGTFVKANKDVLYSELPNPYRPYGRYDWRGHGSQKTPLAVRLGDESLLVNGARLTWPQAYHQTDILTALQKSHGRFGVIPFHSIVAAWTNGKVRDWTQAPIPTGKLRKEVGIVVPSTGERWREVTEKDKQGKVHTRQVHTLGDSVVRVRDRYYLSAVDETGVGSGMYYLAELLTDRAPASLDDALNFMKPKVVRDAEARGSNVRRQGEWFAIPTKLLTSELMRDVERGNAHYRQGHVLGRDGHHELEEAIIYRAGPRKGEVYARGVLRHTKHEHEDLDLGTIRWHLVVHNIQGASYTLSGGGTAAQFD